jgi:hypothetical protein
MLRRAYILMAVLFIYGSEKKRGSFSCWSSRVSGGYSVAVFAAFLRAKAPSTGGLFML